MTEDRKEIKEGVKAKVIDMLATQLSQETDFEALKKELAAELLGIEKEIKTRREFNEDGGLIPLNDYERKFKQTFGFVFDPAPVRERFKGKIDNWANKSVFGENYDVDHIKTSDDFIVQNAFSNDMKKDLEKLKNEINKLRLKHESELKSSNSKEEKELVESMFDPIEIKDNLEPILFEEKNTISIFDKKEEPNFSSGYTSTFIFDAVEKPKTSETPEVIKAPRKPRKPIRANSQKSLKKKPAKRKG